VTTMRSVSCRDSETTMRSVSCWASRNVAACFAYARVAIARPTEATIPWSGGEGAAHAAPPHTRGKRHVLGATTGRPAA
jgi:hypothetical protein